MRFTTLIVAVAFSLVSVPAQGRESSCEHVQCSAGPTVVTNEDDCKWACGPGCQHGAGDRRYYWVKEPGVFEQCICGADRILCSSDLGGNSSPESEINYQCRDGAWSSEIIEGSCPRKGSQSMRRKVKKACGRSGGSWSCSSSSSPPRKSESEINYQCSDGAMSSEIIEGSCPKRGSHSMRRSVREACGRSGGSWSCRSHRNDGGDTGGFIPALLA